MKLLTTEETDMLVETVRIQYQQGEEFLGFWLDTLSTTDRAFLDRTSVVVRRMEESRDILYAEENRVT